jgi:hypothetical protein
VPSEKSLDMNKKCDHFYDIGKGNIFKEGLRDSNHFVIALFLPRKIRCASTKCFDVDYRENGVQVKHEHKFYSYCKP